MPVLIGYIPDEFGEAALSAGTDEARRRGTSLVVVNASQGRSLVDHRYADDDTVKALSDRLDALDVETDLRHGVVPDVAEELIRLAGELSAEVIVVGVRSRTPVGKLLLGSVAQRVILDAPCAVLCVKP